MMIAILSTHFSTMKSELHTRSNCRGFEDWLNFMLYHYEARPTQSGPTCCVCSIFWIITIIFRRHFLYFLFSVFILSFIFLSSLHKDSEYLSSEAIVVHRPREGLKGTRGQTIVWG